MQLLISTKNDGKIFEFRTLLPDFKILSLHDFPEIDDVIEDGETFAANAIKKARTLAEHTGQWAVADDSGLETDALNGQPGVYSARYAGEPCDPAKNIDKLLHNLRDITDDKRTARFRCVIALAGPSGTILTADGQVEGRILRECRGHNGFGYDPIFFSPELGKTFGEATADEKHLVSHRARALAHILPHILAMSF